MNTIDKNPVPPKWPLRFFRWFCRPELVEDIEGDLLERFNQNIEVVGPKKAKHQFNWQVLLLFRMGIIRNNFNLLENQRIMFRQNLKISWRSLKKNKGFALINISGLSLGIMAFILISLWMYDELTFDKSFENHGKIAQVMLNLNFDDAIRTGTGQAMQLAPALRNTYGNYFEEVVTTSGTGNRLLTWRDKKVVRSGNFMEPGITNMLSLTMIKGSRLALEDPSSIILAKSTAEAIFGDEEAMGQSLKIANTMEVQVAGIYEDLPENSTFSGLSFIAPWDLLNHTEKFDERLEWGNRWFNVFVKIANHTAFEQATAAIKNMVRDHIDEESANVYNPEIFLQPMEKWRLYSRFENGINTGGRIENVRLFGIIGAFVLLLACINFMNLSTARSEKRAKEVGIRKTIGSARNQIIGQFLSESLLVVIFSFAVALLVSWLALPFFNAIAEKNMYLPWQEIESWYGSILFIVMLSLLSGSYPAFYLSAFKPIGILQGRSRKSDASFTLRRVLVTAQFIVSVALIIGTLIIVLQVRFAKTRPIGYDQHNIVTVPIKTPEIMRHFETISRELVGTGDVQAVAASDVTMAATFTTNSGFNWKGKDPAFSEEFNTLRATHGFGDLVGWEVIEGRDFSKEHGTDSLSFILNETAVKYMGLDNPIGELIEWGKNASNGTFQVIGVIKDMITTSPYEAVRPMIYVLHYGRFIQYLNLRINGESSTPQALQSIENVFKKHDPENIFEYQFMDQEYANKFGNEERLAKLITYFAILAIFISCIGLFGICALVMEQRKKEIGIRKILGASLNTLWSTLSMEFLKLVLLAVIIAIPISYHYMQGWLEGFAYRIDLHWWIFGIGALMALVITLLTISFHTIRAAISNPMEALQHE